MAPAGARRGPGLGLLDRAPVGRIAREQRALGDQLVQRARDAECALDAPAVLELQGRHCAAGFQGGTVPALKLDGRRVQGSLARALDELIPERPLFPGGAEARRGPRRPSAGATRSCRWCRGGSCAGG